MITELFQEQVEDALKMAQGSDIPNFSEAGTGKTLSAIGAIEAAGLQSGLIICPKIALRQWEDALTYELGARVQRIVHKSDEMDKLADFVVTSWGMVADTKDKLMSRNYGALIPDEAHKARTRDAQRTQAVYGPKCDGKDSLMEVAQQCWPLTGTPIERYADDLWPLMRSMHPEVLYKFGCLDFDTFQHMFTVTRTIEVRGEIITRTVRNQNEKLLSSLLYKHVGAIRRTLAEVEPHMPPALFLSVEVDHKINSELKTLLANIQEYRDAHADDPHGSNDPFTARARSVLALAKAPGVVEYVLEAYRRVPALIGFWHTDAGAAICDGLTRAGKTAAIIDGGTSVDYREHIKQGFAAGRIQYIVGQIAAMGEAMDGLQHACNHAVLAEPDYSGAKLLQFYRRLQRRGQKHPVNVDLLIGKTELDERAYSTARRKLEGAHLILDSE